MGGFCVLVELHWEGSASAACAAGLYIKLHDTTILTWKIVMSKVTQKKEERQLHRLDGTSQVTEYWI